MSFIINTKQIDNVTYYTINTTNQDLTVDLNLNGLKKIADIHTSEQTSTGEKKSYKVINPNVDANDKVLKTQLAAVISDLELFQEKLGMDSIKKQDE